MRKLLFAAAAAALSAAPLAHAAPHTFDVIWSGAMFGNDASAKGVFTFDDTIVPDIGGENVHFVADGGITSLSLDVTGASSGNGHFTLADFEGFFFAAASPLDYSKELIGQSMGNGCTFGDFTPPCYGTGGSGDFNLFGPLDGAAPFGTSFFTLATSGGLGDHMAVTSMAPGGVPEPAAWTLMIGGFGLAGAGLRRKRGPALEKGDRPKVR